VRFEETLRYRPFALVSPGFEQVASEPVQRTNTPAALHRTDEGPEAPFAAVELTVGDGGGVVVAGLLSGDGDSLLATYDLATGRAGLELSTGGSTRVIAVRSGGPRSVQGIAFVLCENQATVLVDDGNGWQPLVTSRRNVAAFTDFRDPAVLGRYTYAYGVRPNRGSSSLTRRSSSLTRWSSSLTRWSSLSRPLSRWSSPSRPLQPVEPQDSLATVTSVRAGVFGMVGVRDPHVIVRADGTPYVRDGRLYLTLTCAGLGFFQQAHCGVFTLDLDDLTSLKQVAHLFFRRDGVVLGDHAGHIVVDGDRLLVAVSSWGDFAPGNISVRHTVADASLLSGVHVLDCAPLALPTVVGSWDPALARIEGRWYVAFVESPTQSSRFEFHPALAVGESGSDYDGPLELVGADTRRRQCEGPILAQVDPAVVVSTSSTTDVAWTTGMASTTGAEWRVLASDSDAQEYPVYDLTMRQVGTLAAPYGTNIPHPQVVTVHGAAGPRHIMISFDGTSYAEPVMGYGTHGDLVILSAPATP
jgi:hypothetical protein